MGHREKTLGAMVLVAAIALPSAGFCVGPKAEPAGVPPTTAALAARDLSLVDGSRVSEMKPVVGVGTRTYTTGSDRKNPMVALLLSCVLPGWGEIYTGHTTRGRAFIAAEAGIWVGYAAYTLQGNMREDDYREFAGLFAGVREDLGDGYYEDIADYTRSEGYDSYNEAIRSEARSLFPDDLEAQRDYVNQHGYFGELAWEWDSESNFDKYRDLRHRASISYTNAFYMTGLAVLNRALSAIDSAWMARRHNQGIAGEPSARLMLTPDLSDGSVGGRAALEISF
jgi:hypothetical protein